MSKKFLLFLIVVCGVGYYIYNNNQKKEAEENGTDINVPLDAENLNLYVSEQKQCTNVKKNYFETSGNRYYLACVNEAWLVKSEKITFYNGLTTGVYTMEDIKPLFTATKKEGYTLYKNDKAGLIVCDNGDVVIGKKDIEFKEIYCQRNCTFTRTYYIMNVEDYDKDNFSITLTFDNEIETVKVAKSYMKKYKINAAYEFTFLKDEADGVNNTSAKAIFDVFQLSSVKKSSGKEGNFINETVCNLD